MQGEESDGAWEGLLVREVDGHDALDVVGDEAHEDHRDHGDAICQHMWKITDVATNADHGG